MEVQLLLVLNLKQFIFTNMEIFSPLEQHRHNGIDSPKLDPKNFKGFPIFTSAPTHNAQEGTIILANESGTYYLYAFIDGAWQKVELT